MAEPEIDFSNIIWIVEDGKRPDYLLENVSNDGLSTARFAGKVHQTLLLRLRCSIHVQMQRLLTGNYGCRVSWSGGIWSEAQREEDLAVGRSCVVFIAISQAELHSVHCLADQRT